MAMDFEKDTTIFMVGRYVYGKNIECVCIKTRYLKHKNYRLIPAFLIYLRLPLFRPYQSLQIHRSSLRFSLLIYSASAVTNSYKSNDEVERQSFLMYKRF